LISQPQPGELNHHRSQARVPRRADAVLALDRAASPRCRREPGIGRDLPAIGKGSEEALQLQHRRELGTDALEPREEWSGGVGLSLHQRVALGLDVADLSHQEFDSVQQADELGLQVPRQLTTITGLQGLQARTPVTSHRIVTTHALAGEQSAYPIDFSDALADQCPALAGQAPPVLLLGTRRSNH
jgi:hypothetical protein